MSTWRNYFGQLRLYSYADLLLLLAALGATTCQVLGATLLWFGFLIYLEWRHNDRGRRPWPWYGWALPWLAAFEFVPFVYAAAALCCAAIYAEKKRPGFGYISVPANGLLKLALTLPLGPTALQAAGIWALATLRNLAGDVRDAGKDAAEGLRTIPVVLGYAQNTPYVYPLSLAFTSSIWCIAGGLSIGWLLAVWTIQALTYRLTPR